MAPSRRRLRTDHRPIHACLAIPCGGNAPTADRACSGWRPRDSEAIAEFCERTRQHLVQHSTVEAEVHYTLNDWEQAISTAARATPHTTSASRARAVQQAGQDERAWRRARRMATTAEERRNARRRHRALQRARWRRTATQHIDAMERRRRAVNTTFTHMTAPTDEAVWDAAGQAALQHAYLEELWRPGGEHPARRRTCTCRPRCRRADLRACAHPPPLRGLRTQRRRPR